jgi:hypothetical protein
MALIGINPTERTPSKRSALESIALGAQIANQVIGAAAAGAGAYSELFGNKAKLYESEIAKNQAANQDNKVKVKQAMEDRFSKNETVQSVNNLNDVYLTAKAFADKPKVDRASGVHLTTKYIQAMFPKSNVRMSPDGSSVVSDSLDRYSINGFSV